jgi:hypothetical protein
MPAATVTQVAGTTATWPSASHKPGLEKSGPEDSEAASLPSAVCPVCPPPASKSQPSSFLHSPSSAQ